MGWFTDTGKTETACCSFCQRSYRDVGPLVEGPNRVFICTACLHACNSVMQQELDRQQGKIRAFLAVGATYRFTTDSGTSVGILRTRLPHPNEHWIQVDSANPSGAGAYEPTWINLLHVHTVSEIASASVGTTVTEPSGAPVVTDVRVFDSKRDSLK